MGSDRVLLLLPPRRRGAAPSLLQVLGPGVWEVEEEDGWCQDVTGSHEDRVLGIGLTTLLEPKSTHIVDSRYHARLDISPTHYILNHPD